MAKTEVNANLLNSNFNFKNNFSNHIPDKSLGGRSATLHIFGDSILQVSRNLK